MKLRQLVHDLGALRFEKVSQCGSHVKMRHLNGRSVMIYAHGRNEEVSRAVSRSILRAAASRATACHGG